MLWKVPMFEVVFAPPQVPGVLVVGPHRSGTSAVTHALTEAGLLGVPADDRIGADWSNPDGHWESWRLMRINDRLLRAVGGRWDDPHPVPADLLDPNLDREAWAAFELSFPHGPWVWKDPRVCLTLPYWLRLFRDRRHPVPTVVLCLRHPLEIAQSLLSRNGFPLARGLELWRVYLSSALAALEGLAVHVTWFEDFLEHPNGWLNDVRRFLQTQAVTLTADPAVDSQVSAVPRPVLRHHRTDVIDSVALTENQQFLWDAATRLRSMDQFARPNLAPLRAARPAGGPHHQSVWVAGFPSEYGGADTELDHLIDLFRHYGVEIHLVPMFGSTLPMRRSVLARGCCIDEYQPDVFADRTVVSFCNGAFLEHLPEIMRQGAPAKVIWFNCMTWPFDAELAAHERGWIDYFGFESSFQQGILGPSLEEVGPYQSFAYRPYFNRNRIRWHYREPDGTYRVGRISRDDAAKFAPDTWRIFDRVLVPPDVRKKVFVLGFGPRAREKIGEPPVGMDWMTWSPDAIQSTQFYRGIDTLIHKTGGSRESYGRFLVEAYAHGVVPIVEDAFAFPDLVVHGETGFRGQTSDEMSYYASQLAFQPGLHRRMAEAGRAFLDELVDPVECFRPWLDVL